jgi:hypothetical protein
VFRGHNAGFGAQYDSGDGTFARKSTFKRVDFAVDPADLTERMGR